MNDILTSQKEKQNDKINFSVEQFKPETLPLGFYIPAAVSPIP